MIAMKFTIELEIGLSFLLRSALPQLVTDRATNTHRRGRSKRSYGHCRRRTETRKRNPLFPGADRRPLQPASTSRLPAREAAALREDRRPRGLTRAAACTALRASCAAPPNEELEGRLAGVVLAGPVERCVERGRPLRLGQSSHDLAHRVERLGQARRWVCEPELGPPGTARARIVNQRIDSLRGVGKRLGHAFRPGCEDRQLLGLQRWGVDPPEPGREDPEPELAART
jgi:hypothetical protein